MPADTDALPAEVLTWERLCSDPEFAYLQNVPAKVETNARGQILMSPTRFRHGFYQKRIARLLDDLGGGLGESITEVAVETEDGVKVPDVGWFTAAQVDEAWDAFAVQRAPAVCVEVLSPFNVWSEIEEKMGLYFLAGAEEVWICDTDGRMHVYHREHGEQPASERFPDFPRRIER
ncbi:MAG: Uma2 family endonuclease [Bacteroidota bacterium]